MHVCYEFMQPAQVQLQAHPGRNSPAARFSLSKMRRSVRAYLVLVHDAVVQPARVQPQARPSRDAPCAPAPLARAGARAPVLHQQLPPGKATGCFIRVALSR